MPLANFPLIAPEMAIGGDKFDEPWRDKQEKRKKWPHCYLRGGRIEEGYVMVGGPPKFHKVIPPAFELWRPKNTI